MSLEIRKFVDYSELVHIEGFKKAEKPLHIFAVAAVITNPWSGKFIEDLKLEKFGLNFVLSPLDLKPLSLLPFRLKLFLFMLLFLKFTMFFNS